MKKITLLCACAVAATLAGCGGSGSTMPSATPSSPVTTASVSGAVADGYLVNATVFLDKNRNYQLDTGEPSAVTDGNGAYTLQLDPADVGRYPIVAVATQGVTIDKDTGTTVTGSYLLSMHAVAVTSSTAGTVAGTVSNFISPMSSQIRELMETGKYATIQQAMDQLRAQLGLPAGTNMMQDYIASGNTTMHTAARNMATLMGSQMSLVLNGSGVSPTVDVNRYRSMMGIMYSNSSSLGSPNAQATMATLMNSMHSNLTGIPAGMTFRNMSTVFRGGMMRW